MELCNSKLYDLICLDQHMPYVTGDSFFMALRSREGINKNTPVIMLSSENPNIPGNKIFYLDKPIDYDRLFRFIKILGL